MRASGNFAHKKVADAFFRGYGLRISFSFKLMRFVGNLQYLLTPGKKPSTDLDTSPATFPPNLDLAAELKKAPTPCVDDSYLKEEDHAVKGALAPVAARIVLKILYVARVCRHDLLFAVNALARTVSNWTIASDKKLLR